MVKGQQTWVGIGLGAVVLIGLFLAGYAVVGGGNAVAVDGGQLALADGSGGDDGSGSGDAISDVTASGGDGEVRSFSSDDTGAVGDEDRGGLALRVVIGDDASSNTAAPTSGSASASDSNPSSSSSPTSSSSSTAPPRSSSSTTVAPAPTTESTAAATSSSTTATTAKTAKTDKTDKTATTAKDTTTSTAETSTSASETTAATMQTTTAPPPTTAADNSTDARGFEAEVIRLTNEARGGGGCGPLANNGKLHAAALAHSTDMEQNDYFSHTSRDGSSMVDRIERHGYNWRRLAENIAAGYRTPASVVDGWMNSPGHRANIMNCDLTEIGVGFYNYYWTQNFGTPG